MQNHNHMREKSFVIRVQNTTSTTTSLEALQYCPQANLNFSAMKIFNRFRKLLMRLILSLPSRGSSSSSATTPRHRNGDVRFDPPKTSCSSYYSSHSHYNEAIADCIEFFNKSSQEGILDGRKSSDVLV